MKYKIVAVLAVLMVWFIIFISFIFKLSMWPLLIFFVIILSVFVLGAIYIGLNFYVNSINSLLDIRNENSNAITELSEHPISNIEHRISTIMLTFDDGIHPIFTSKVLDILSEQRVKAMFFIIGKHIKGNEAILKRIADEGHVIGNHSCSHDFWFDMKSARSMKADVEEMNLIVEKELGFRPTYFRPPYGVTNPNLARAIQKTGMTSVGWNLRSMDTVAKSKGMLLDKLKKKTKPNCIVLLHDRCQITVDTLTDYIVFCKEQGYTFTTL